MTISSFDTNGGNAPLSEDENGLSTISSATPVSPTGLALLIDQTARAVYSGREHRALTPAQWATLRYFSRAGSSDRTMMGLVRYQRVSPATASETISLLVKRGLLTKERDQSDRRRYLLKLTADAEAMMVDDPIHRLSKAIGELDERSYSYLAESLNWLVSTLAKDTGSRPSIIGTAE